MIFRIVSVCLLVLVFASACLFSKNLESYPQNLAELNLREARYDVKKSEQTGWYYSKSLPAHAKVLVAHGLNTRPSAMNAWVDLLNQSGFDVLRLSLSGFGGEFDYLKEASRASWLNDLRLAFLELKKHKPELKRYALSYSFSSTLLIDYINHNSDSSFDGLVLIAPAIGLHTKAQLGRAFTWLRYFGLALPSIAPKLYRAHSFLPLKTYHEFYSTLDAIWKHTSQAHLQKLPALLLMSKHDKLINLKKTKSWLKKKELSHWQVVEFDLSQANSAFQHVLLDQESVGQDDWKKMKELVLAQFSAPSF